MEGNLSARWGEAVRFCRVARYWGNAFFILYFALTKKQEIKREGLRTYYVPFLRSRAALIAMQDGKALPLGALSRSFPRETVRHNGERKKSTGFPVFDRAKWLDLPSRSAVTAPRGTVIGQHANERDPASRQAAQYPRARSDM